MKLPKSHNEKNRKVKEKSEEMENRTRKEGALKEQLERQAKRRK